MRSRPGCGVPAMAQRLEEPDSGRFGLAFAGRAQEPDPRGGLRRRKGGAVVVLVADQDLPRPAEPERPARRDHRGVAA